MEGRRSGAVSPSASAAQFHSCGSQQWRGLGRQLTGVCSTLTPVPRLPPLTFSNNRGYPQATAVPGRYRGAVSKRSQGSHKELPARRCGTRVRGDLLPAHCCQLRGPRFPHSPPPAPTRSGGQGRDGQAGGHSAPGSPQPTAQTPDSVQPRAALRGPPPRPPGPTSAGRDRRALRTSLPAPPRAASRCGPRSSVPRVARGAASGEGCSRQVEPGALSFHVLAPNFFGGSCVQRDFSSQDQRSRW